MTLIRVVFGLLEDRQKHFAYTSKEPKRRNAILCYERYQPIEMQYGCFGVLALAIEIALIYAVKVAVGLNASYIFSFNNGIESFVKARDYLLVDFCLHNVSVLFW